LDAQWNTGNSCDAKAKDFRLYNRALSAAEIGAMYNPQTRWSLYQPRTQLIDVTVAAAGGFQAAGATQQSRRIGAGI